MSTHYSYSGEKNSSTKIAIDVLNILEEKRACLQQEWDRVLFNGAMGIQGSSIYSLPTMNSILLKCQSITDNIKELEENIMNNPVDDRKILEKIRMLASSVRVIVD